jgi:hypothetical protein
VSEAYHGSCLCGEVQFEITPPTRFCAHCHCSYCRRAHGAALVTWVGVPHGQFRFTSGEGRVVRYDSSEKAWRRFCGRCGTMMFFEGERWPGEVHIARATIPGDIDRAPQAHVYFDAGVNWFRIDDHLPKLGGPTGVEPL